jgi:hypothetical protein
VLHRATRVHSELNENIEIEVRQNLQYKIDELQETLTGEDLTSIRESTSILQQEVERITVMISQLNEVSDDTENNISQPESGSDEKNQTSPDSDSDVVDGNFTEV